GAIDLLSIDADSNIDARRLHGAAPHQARPEGRKLNCTLTKVSRFHSPPLSAAQPARSRAPQWQMVPQAVRVAPRLRASTRYPRRRGSRRLAVLHRAFAR